MRWENLLLFFACVLIGSGSYGASLQSADFPSLVSALRGLDALEFCGEKTPLEIQEVRERMEKELLLSLWNRPQAILWLKRSTRYLPHIERMLKENGMPDDLKYVAVAESALRPHVGSRKGALGFWQFRAHTGRRFGLVINRQIDERRNLFSSTRAAIRYFKELHGIFGSWTLALAAYNMGEEGLSAEILEQEIKEYYRLYLPIETQRFLFRVLSIKLILSDPKAFGFELDKADYYPPLEFDQVQVKCGQETPIRIIAQAAGTDFKAIKDLNPEIRGHRLTKGNHALLIPKGTSANFHARYQGLAKRFIENEKERVYVVQKGDSLSEIAERFDVPLPALLIWNRLDPKRPIHPGDRLVVYPESTQSERIDASEDSP